MCVIYVLLSVFYINLCFYITVFRKISKNCVELDPGIRSRKTELDSFRLPWQAYLHVLTFDVENKKSCKIINSVISFANPYFTYIIFYTISMSIPSKNDDKLPYFTKFDRDLPVGPPGSTRLFWFVNPS